MYFPYFDSGQLDDQLCKFRDTVGFIEQVFIENPFHNFIICADFNCNIFNDKHPFSISIRNFMESYDLRSTYDFDPKFDHTKEWTRMDFEKKDGTAGKKSVSYSLLDGFIISNSLFSKVKRCCGDTAVYREYCI